MHDFCFTIPYGLLLVCGGAIGCVKKGGTASLAGVVGTGLLLILAGYLSLQAFHKRKTSYFALVLETGQSNSLLLSAFREKHLVEGMIIIIDLSTDETCIAGLLTWVMGQRYMQTGKIMPAGIVAVISILMTVFYLYKIATGGNHISPKTE